MIREKRTVNCWLLTKSKRKKGKERRKTKGGKEEEERKKEREEKTKKAWKEIKATAKGNLQKPLQLPFILPIELITAFFNFQKLISSGSTSKQNYMMHTGHSCNFIDPFRCITDLSEAYLFETQPQQNKKRSIPPPIAEAHLASSSFKKLLSNAEIFISNSNLNAGIFIP